MMKLRQILIQYEIENNLTHDDMIQKIGIGRSTYFRWLSGESTKLKHGTLEKLSNVIGQDVESLLDNEENIKPILGQVKAGYDLWADQNIEGYIELGQVDAKKGDYFLRVVGDSMEGCYIFDGDLVFIKQCNEVISGQIAVVMVGEEATIKKIYYKNDLMILEAANPKYDSKFFTMQEVEELPVKVIGLVKFVRRDFTI